MTSRHLVDPELWAALDAFPRVDFSDATIAPIRQMLGTFNPEQVAPVIAPIRRHAPGRNGAPDVGLLVFDPPRRQTRAAILQIHGGGMILGSAEMSSLVNAELAVTLGVVVVAVDYRLAPEHPFPAPQEDCLAGYDWLVDHAGALGIARECIAIAGESAGGGLAAALAIMARDLGRPAPCAQILTYPMLDYRTGSSSQPGLAHTGEFVWTRESNRYGWDALRGSYDCADHRKGWFSPALAEDLSNLPATWIATGSLDLFVEENLNYAKRLIAAGVPVELHLYPGGTHGFDIAPAAAITRGYHRGVHAAFTKALGL